MPAFVAPRISLVLSIFPSLLYISYTKKKDVHILSNPRFSLPLTLTLSFCVRRPALSLGAQAAGELVCSGVPTYDDLGFIVGMTRCSPFHAAAKEVFVFEAIYK